MENRKRDRKIKIKEDEIKFGIPNNFNSINI